MIGLGQHKALHMGAAADGLASVNFQEPVSKKKKALLRATSKNSPCQLTFL
jgi:hypothetical protein